MTPPTTPATTRHLRDLVANRLDKHWSDFAQAHPHLAEAIDRARLVELSVSRLADDPRFIEAMQQAAVDEAALTAAVRLVDEAEQWVRRLLG